MMQNYRDDNEFYNAYLDLIRIPRIREIKKKKKKKNLSIVRSDRFRSL